MFIQILRPPVAGTSFRFTVAGACGATSVEVFVDQRSIMRRDYRQMLCHGVATIPGGSEGRTLTVTAIDEHGHHKSLDYEISAADPGPHSMLSVTRPWRAADRVT